MSKDSRRGSPRNPGAPATARDRAREMAVRRAAKLQGYRAEKSRRRSAAPDFGTWLLYGPRGGLVPELTRQVSGAPAGVTLDELEKFLGITPPPDTDG
jgi:hypothetical protein